MKSAMKSAMTGVDPRLLRLSDSDNVLVVRSRLRAGEIVTIGGRSITLATDAPLGHKLASRDVVAGEKIVKYGAPIGSATTDIALGAHVHVHNMKSDYTPTHHLYEARARHGEAP